MIFTFILCPHLLDFVKIFVIQGLITHFRVLVVKLTVAFKLIIDPISFVGKFSRLVVKLPLTLHSIKSPLAFIHTSVLIVKDTESMTHILPFVAFILASLLVSFNYVLSTFGGSLSRRRRS